MRLSNLLARTGRRRRGSNVVEFALLLPFFLGVYFSIMEYGWYFYQRSGVVEAARNGCRAAVNYGVDDDFADLAGSAIESRLATVGITCDGSTPYKTCDLDVVQVGANPTRLRCDVSVPYEPIVGFVRLILPGNVRGRGVAIYEDS